MTWTTRYQQPNPATWTGRTDAPEESCFFQIIRKLNLLDGKITPTTDQPAFGLIGFCCDEGVKRNLGRVGAAEGPAAIRAALYKLPISKPDILCYDAGDITCDDGDLESAQAALAEVIYILLTYGITPIVLGGGHELAWGEYQGIHKYINNDAIAVVNFDAHLDMRSLLKDNKGTSGTSFLQIANANIEAKRKFSYSCLGVQRSSNNYELFKTANQYETNIIYAEDFYQNSNKCFDLLNYLIFYNRHIYLSICLDVFASPFAPGVSAPQALGITPWKSLPYIKILAASGKVISYDIAELLPAHDIDNCTANLAANLINEIIYHHTKL